MNDSIRTTMRALAMTLALALAGCGGGGGGGGSAGGTVEVAPSLGRFSAGTPVVIRGADGKVLGTGSIGANGKAGIDIGDYQGILIVEVQGGGNASYFEEATGESVPFPAGAVLRAVVPAVTAAVGVTALTHAAAAQLVEIDGSTVKVMSGKDRDDIAATNTEIARQFGLTDILAAPVLVDANTPVSGTDGDAGTYALLLAALSRQGCGDVVGCTMHAHLAADAIADDLMDGDLDGANATEPTDLPINAAQLNGRLDAAIDQHAKADSKGYFMARFEMHQVQTGTPELSEAEKTALMESGGDIAQAKAMFDGIRTSLFPYANPQQTGFLDQEGARLHQEFNQLGLDLQQGTDEISYLVNWAATLHRLNELPSRCQGSLANATCTIPTSQGPREVNITDNGGAWSMEGGTLTGTIVYDDDEGDGVIGMKLSGDIHPMSPSATKARVGTDTTPLEVTLANPGQDLFRLGLAGSIEDQTCQGNDCTPVLMLVIGPGAYVVNHEPPPGEPVVPTQNELHLPGTIITDNYRFDGEMDINQVQVNNAGFHFKFSGTVNGQGLAGKDNVPNNDFTLLEGTLDGTANIANFDPEKPLAADNFPTGTATFTGTARRSAQDAGLELVFVETVTDWERGNFTVTHINLPKNLTLTGSGSYDHQGTAPQQLTLTSGGIEVALIEGSDTTIKKGPAVLGHISGGRINYVDGTSASLL